MNLKHTFTALLCCAALAVASSALAQSDDLTPMATPKALTLINGWYNSPFNTSKAQVVVVDGIVHFKGAIAGTGTNPTAFVLPVGYRPSKYLSLPIDLLQAKNGRLFITPNGEASVLAEGSQNVAYGFTSLDGASFALNSDGFKALTLINGWKNNGAVNGTPGVKNINGIVHFRGAIVTTGSNAEPFVLPVGFRPAKTVQLSLDLCGVSFGRLTVYPDGTTDIQAETVFSNAQCFTSLDGAWFATNNTGFQTLPLVNGWFNDNLTFPAKAKLASGIVYLEGAISTSGVNPAAFVLPSSMTPTTNVYIPVNLCNATKGRLDIAPDGYVSVQAENAFSSAQCFTSLDGVSFVK